MNESNSSSKAYLLRVEGMNLANVIDDTDQLSVRRGGGLMILNTPDELYKKLLDPSGMELLNKIALGASIGLFQFEKESKEEAEGLRQRVENALHNGCLEYKSYEGKDSELPLKYGTFVVDVVPIAESENVQQAEQLATTKNRWRQLQEPTLSLAELWDKIEGDDKKQVPCEWNRTRTGTDFHTDPEGNNVQLSKTVVERWHYGRGARQKFYEEEFRQFSEEDAEVSLMLNNLRFTDDLKKLSGKIDKPTDEEKIAQAQIPDNLYGKIAVFYVDGNSFGQKGREIFENHGSDGYKEWSEKLRGHHQKLLHGLVGLTEYKDHWKNGDEIRLETLLWGGDEILWVVPAWKGWEVAKWFFEQAHRVTVQDEEQELTYGCGLIFCHAKAPISNISALAKKLGDVAKKVGDVAKDSRNEENKHCLAYEVLESYDDISGDLEAHRKRFLPSGADVNELVFNPIHLEDHWKTLTSIANCAEFPMRQLYSLVSKWRNGEEYKEHAGRLKDACKESKIEIGPLLEASGDPIGWLHLLQMLPYLPSEEQSPEAVEQTGGDS